MDIYNIANKMKLQGKTVYDLDLRVTFYARVSTQREEQNSSVEHQIEYFKELIKNNKHWTYVEGYVDRVRGESAMNRKNFQRMIADAYNNKFDLILTKEVSRFARNTIDSLTYTRDLLRQGVGVFFQNDNICTIDSDSELRLTIMSSIAQDEVRKLSERIKFGHKKSIENGKVLGNSRIWGYNYVDGKLSIDEKEAQMIKDIFEMYATGDYSIRDIEDVLYEKGYRNHNGNRLHHTTIGDIIQNPKYKGYYCGNKVKVIDYRTKEQKFLPQEQWVMFKDETGETVPQIVNEEIWNKANAIFKERSDKVKSAGRSARSMSRLSGKIKCGVHGGIFWRSSYSERLHPDKSIYQWICKEKKLQRNARACDTFPIYESELYKILSNIICDLNQNKDEYIEEAISLYKEMMSDDNIQDETQTLHKNLIKLQNKKDKLLDLYTDDVITKNEFKDRNKKIGDEITTIKEQIASLETMKDEEHSIINGIKRVREILNQEVNTLVTSNEINTNLIDTICDDLLDSITVYPVDEDTMELRIKLKIGAEQRYEYINTHRRSSGHIFKKMISKQRIRFPRKKGHLKLYKHYIVTTYI